MPTLRAAAVQLSPVLYSREGTVDKVCRQIEALGREGVQFAVFPETVVPYYPYFSFVQPPFAMGKQHLKLLDESVQVPSAATLAIGEACRAANMVVSIGVNERDGGINGVKLLTEECETGYATDKGVECYERMKSKGPTGASYFSPLSTGRSP